MTLTVVPNTTNARYWGDPGHRIIGEVAATNLPAEMPKFFRDARAQLTYLNPDADRWRHPAEVRADSAMNEFHAPEHYFDFEYAVGQSLNAVSRYAFIDSLHAHGMKTATAGFLPYRILELSQSLRVQWRIWHATKDSAVKRMVEQRILNDAGILGHYVADGSNPHHTTIHHDRWVAAQNPKGFTTERGFHSRFESRYVERNITLPDVQPIVAGTTPRVLNPLRDNVWSYLQTSFGQLDRLYSLDKIEPFGPETKGAAHKQFTAERLAAAATMLRDIWWTAYVTSAPEIQK